MQTNQPTAEQFISNKANATNAATVNNMAAGRNANINTVTGKTDRPFPITIICILGMIGFGLSAIGLMIGWSIIALVSPVFLVYTIAAVAANMLAIIWMWQMKKKGAYLYAGVFVAGIVVSIIYGVFAITIAFLISAAVTGIALFYSKQMK